MPQDLHTIVQRMVEAGEPEENIALVIQHYQPPPATAPAKTPSLADAVLADNPMMGLPTRAIQGLLRMVKANPVESAATAGALLAAPATGGASILGGMAGAGLGAAGGAGLAIAGRQLATGRPESGIETAKTMATQGAVNAAGEGVGRGIASAANVVVPKVLKGILRPYKNVQQEFGDVVGVMRRERIPVGKSDVAGARMGESAKQASQMIADAEAAGAAPIRPREVTKKLGDVRDVTTQRARLGKPDETGEVAARARSFQQKNKGGIPLTEAQSLKQAAQKEASTVFRAIDRGNVVKDTGALMDKAIAQGLREGIEARVPAVRGVNARTQELMGLERALSDAEARSGGVVGMNPANWLSGIAPGMGSNLTFAADATAQAQQAPLARLLRQALLSALAGDDQQ